MPEQEFRVYRNDAVLPVARLTLEEFGDQQITLNRNLYTVDMETANDGVWERIGAAEKAGDFPTARGILLDALALAISTSDPQWTRQRLGGLPPRYLADFLAFFAPRTRSVPPPTRESSTETETTGSAGESAEPSPPARGRKRLAVASR